MAAVGGHGKTHREALGAHKRASLRRDIAV